MTKVLTTRWISRLSAVFALLLSPFVCTGQIASAKPAEALYMQLSQAGLDPARIYKVRDAALDRPAIHISLEDGTIGFTQDVLGRITGAFFEGDGEILLTPPDEVERQSLGLFAGMAILEERFATAYFRFDDDLFAELRPDLRQPDDKEQFLSTYQPTAKNLANADAMRLLTTFSRMLPANGGEVPAGTEAGTVKRQDRFLHARLQGTKLGVFDVYYDSSGTEQVMAGQAKAAQNGDTYYNVWTSFSLSPTKGERESTAQSDDPQPQRGPGGRIAVQSYAITTEVLPPTRIHAKARVRCEAREDGARALLFELSRFLEMESVTVNGVPVEYIHNPALEGTQLARQGNDAVVVILPRPSKVGEKLDLEFAYGGEVLAEAGSGLLYVGARGTWYPNRGLEMANFDLQFSYPPGWKLIATGKPSQVSPESAAAAGADKQTSHWISDRPIPLAGFNLGKYREVTVRAGDVSVETYATQGVEKNFPTPPIQVIEPARPAEPVPVPPKVIVPTAPSPTQHELAVGEAAARAIEYYSERFGPFPYSHLALTQIPGRESQGWPGLIFLSSYAFLDDREREQLHFAPDQILLQHSVPAHETAHQWWGDLVMWRTYRDQWLSEGLANYCALMMVQEKNPAGFRDIMNAYRGDLVQKNAEGLTPMDAGPVTLGTRLLSSKFPEGYEAINYGRGTWLFHMLRTMLKDAAEQERGRRNATSAAEEPFVRALRNVRDRYAGKAITTKELLDVFAEELPPSLRYEGKKSLDWFLEGWINGTALPKLELRSVKLISKGTGVVVSGTILQNEAPKDLVTSVPVYGMVAGRQEVLLGRVFVDGEESTFRLAAPTGTHKILLDPNETVLTYPK